MNVTDLKIKHDMEEDLTMYWYGHGLGDSGSSHYWSLPIGGLFVFMATIFLTFRITEEFVYGVIFISSVFLLHQNIIKYAYRIAYRRTEARPRGKFFLSLFIIQFLFSLLVVFVLLNTGPGAYYDFL